MAIPTPWRPRHRRPGPLQRRPEETDDRPDQRLDGFVRVHREKHPAAAAVDAEERQPAPVFGPVVDPRPSGTGRRTGRVRRTPSATPPPVPRGRRLPARPLRATRGPAPPRGTGRTTSHTATSSSDLRPCVRACAGRRGCPAPAPCRSARARSTITDFSPQSALRRPSSGFSAPIYA